MNYKDRRLLVKVFSNLMGDIYNKVFRTQIISTKVFENNRIAKKFETYSTKSMEE